MFRDNEQRVWKCDPFIWYREAPNSAGSVWLPCDRLLSFRPRDIVYSMHQRGGGLSTGPDNLPMAENFLLDSVVIGIDSFILYKFLKKDAFWDDK